MEVFALVGDPVGHSVSPPMHEAAYDALDVDARYVTLEPAEADLGAAIDGARALGIRGLNVTIPYKEVVLSHVDPDPLAARIGAVNTIDFSPGTAGSAASPGSGDVPKGHNTDAAGVTRALEHHGVTLSGKAVVVGAGGAGRAASFALADEGMAVAIANRTVSRAEALAADVPDASAHGLDEVELLLDDADVLVNATSVGMGAPDETPVPTDALGGDLAVLDAVYDPLETRLLREARSVGATTVDGAWMLLYQGVEAFEVWTDHDAPVATMNEALRTALDG